MRPIRLALMVGLICGFASAQVEARNSRLLLSIKDALEQGKSQGVLDESVKLRFGKGNRVGRVIGSDVANRKTNAVNKTDIEACNWVFLSSLRSLQDGAVSSGADAVVEIVSYYKKREFSSATEFECHVGAIMGAVALKGSYAKTK